MLDIYSWLTIHIVHGYARRMKDVLNKYHDVSLSSSKSSLIRNTINSTTKCSRPVRITAQAILCMHVRDRYSKR